MKVSDVLADKPLDGVETINARETLGALVARLREKRIGALVVVDQTDKLVGVVSERDVIRALAEAGERCLSSPIESYMTREVVTAAPSDSAVSVLERMTAGRFRHMPVLNDGALVGIISIGDVVKARIQALQADNAALEEFIRS